MPIKLEDFIAESLSQIVKGVNRAQKEVEGTGAIISPYMRTTADSNSIGQAEGLGAQPCYKVAFDVAVTATEEASTSGGIGVIAAVFTVAGKGQTSDAIANTSRIQFNVPIVLPLQRPKTSS